MAAQTTMPAEWLPHERTWMAFPPPNPTFGDDGSPSLASARELWTGLVNILVRYEPVTLLAAPGQSRTARRMVDARVDVVEVPLDDAWIRDTGPTFVLDAGSGSGVGAVDWRFNGWGAQDWAQWHHDEGVAQAVARLTAVPVHASSLTAEGGGLHVDGEGTVLLTDTVQLDPARNPGWSRQDVETEVHARLGTTKAIWLPRGLARDYDEYGTRGHVDLVATFLRPGVVAVHTQTDPRHPDHELSREIIELLRGCTDARGRVLEVVELRAPTVLEDHEGRPVDYSYINHYVANGVVVVCAFDDPRDTDAADVLAKAYPDRRIEQVDARGFFAHGGGLHCVTQQQPASPPGAGTPAEKEIGQ